MARVTFQQRTQRNRRVVDIPHGTLVLYGGQAYLVHNSGGLRQAVRLDGRDWLSASAEVEILPKGEIVTLEQEAV